MRALSSRRLVGRQLEDATSGQPHLRFTQPIRRRLAFGGCCWVVENEKAPGTYATKSGGSKGTLANRTGDRKGGGPADLDE
jgi:hypothetical protein